MKQLLNFRQVLFKLVTVVLGPLMPCYVLANQVYYTAKYVASRNASWSDGDLLPVFILCRTGFNT